MARRYERHPDISGTEVDGEIFLVKAMEEDIYHLDRVATGLWRLLEQPRQLAELEQIFVEAFPEIPHETIQADLTQTLAELIDAGYVLTRETAGDQRNAGQG